MDLVTLNVGGRRFQTTRYVPLALLTHILTCVICSRLVRRTTLQSAGGMLGAMFGEHWKDNVQQHLTDDGAVFLDADGDAFAQVLSYCRTKSPHVFESSMWPRVRLQMVYFTGVNLAELDVLMLPFGGAQFCDEVEHISTIFRARVLPMLAFLQFKGALHYDPSTAEGRVMHVCEGATDHRWHCESHEDRIGCSACHNADDNWALADAEPCESGGRRMSLSLFKCEPCDSDSTAWNLSIGFYVAGHDPVMSCKRCRCGLHTAYWPATWMSWFRQFVPNLLCSHAHENDYHTPFTEILSSDTAVDAVRQYFASKFGADQCQLYLSKKCFVAHDADVADDWYYSLGVQLTFERFVLPRVSFSDETLAFHDKNKLMARLQGGQCMRIWRFDEKN